MKSAATNWRTTGSATWSSGSRTPGSTGTGPGSSWRWSLPDRAPNEGRLPGRFGHSVCVAISKKRAAENPQIFSGPRFSFWVLFRVFTAGAGPVLCRVQEGGVAVGADVVQRLMVLAVFVAGVIEERLDDLAGLVLPAATGDVSSSQAALLHPAFCRLRSREPSRYPGLQPLQVF